MELKKLSVIVLCCFGFAMTAHANEVLLTANQATKIAFRVVHKDQNGRTIFGDLQSVDVNKNINVSVDLNGYDLAGIKIESVNGHELPSSANQFDQPKQCSMTTNKTKATGALAFTLSAHSINCRTYGGIFG